MQTQSTIYYIQAYKSNFYAYIYKTVELNSQETCYVKQNRIFNFTHLIYIVISVFGSNLFVV